MSHVVPSHQLDSDGNDATDTTNHAVRVNIVAGSSGGGGVTPVVVSGTLGAAPTSLLVTTNGDQTTIAGYNTAQAGGFSGNLFLQVSQDNTLWTAIPTFCDNSNQVWWSPAGAVADWVTYFHANIAGFKYIRVYRGSGSTGTTTWTLVASPAVFLGHSMVTIADPAGNKAAVDGNGQLSVRVPGSVAVSPLIHSSVAVTSVNDDVTAQQLLASNNNRAGATIFNDSTATLYVKLSTTNDASTTSFTIKLAAGAYWEVPFTYSGVISGIWDANTAGAARITEIT